MARHSVTGISLIWDICGIDDPTEETRRVGEKAISYGMQLHTMCLVMAFGCKAHACNVGDKGAEKRFDGLTSEINALGSPVTLAS